MARRKSELQRQADRLAALIVVAECACGRKFVEPEWKALPLLGRQQQFAEDGSRHELYDLELRNCPCGSTRAVEVLRHG